MPSSPEDLLAWQIKAAKLAVPERQYRYAPPRKLRSDFAFPDNRLLVEVQGGVFNRKAHGSITGILADIDRLNTATLTGWRLLRVTPAQVQSGEALALIEAALSPHSFEAMVAKGRKAWADVPNASEWVDEQRGG